MGESVQGRAIRALSNHDRRRILLALLEHDTHHTFNLVDQLAGDRAVRDVEIEFHHIHLPMLDTLGLASWGSEDNVVEPGPDFDDIRPLLEKLQSHPDTPVHELV